MFLDGEIPKELKRLGYSRKGDGRRRFNKEEGQMFLHRLPEVVDMGFASGWPNPNPIVLGICVEKDTKMGCSVPPGFLTRNPISILQSLPYFSSTYLTQARNLRFEMTRSSGCDALN